MRKYNAAFIQVLQDRTTPDVLGDPQLYMSISTVTESGRQTETIVLTVEQATRLVGELNRHMEQARRVRDEAHARQHGS